MIYDLVWWAVPLFAIPFWIITNATHEVSHGIGVLPWGWRFKTYVFAHFLDTTNEETYYIWQKLGWIFNKPEGAQFYFARCDFIRTDKSVTIPDRGWAWVFIAPRLANTLITSICAALFYACQLHPRIDTAFAVWSACNIVDALVGFGSIFYWKPREHTDIWRFQKNTGWNLWLVRAISLLWLGLFALAFFWR